MTSVVIRSLYCGKGQVRTGNNWVKQAMRSSRAFRGSSFAKSASATRGLRHFVAQSGDLEQTTNDLERWLDWMVWEPF
jgi:hypothetical protein